MLSFMLFMAACSFFLFFLFSFFFFLKEKDPSAVQVLLIFYLRAVQKGAGLSLFWSCFTVTGFRSTMTVTNF